MNRNGSQVKVLVSEPSPRHTHNGSPRWSNDGSMIAFDSIVPGTDWRLSKLFVIGVSGPFTGHVVDLGYGLTPSWSPDCSQIAFMLHPGNPDGLPGGIWIMNSDGTEKKFLAEGSIPHWSPQGDLIACTDGFSAHRRVSIIDVRTGVKRPILDGGETTPSRLAWSPSGDKIAFVYANEKKQESIRIVDLHDPV
ncbi:MAG: PD40 domain-containing protein, partial [Planctomycetales bacterium]|nr:PD40 domain-containing protein [Planctomycetales bacterium]